MFCSPCERFPDPSNVLRFDYLNGIRTTFEASHVWSGVFLFAEPKTYDMNSSVESIVAAPDITKEQDEHAIHDVERPPDGGYGWVCVASCFIVNCFTWGVSASYGVYLAHYLSANVFPNATPLDFALIGGFNFSMAMLVAPLVTITARLYGTQVPMLIGVTLLTAGFISASFATQIWQLYLSQGVLVGIGGGFTYIPSIAVVSQWFQEKRSLANGITAAGSGVGGLIFSFVTQAMIDKISLAWSFRITGIVVCTSNLIATVLIRNRNETIKPAQRAFDTKLLHRYDVILLLTWSFVSVLGYLAVLFSLSDYAQSIGLSSSQAAAVSAFCNLGTAIGRPLIGVASDRYGRMEVSGILTLLCGLSCLAIWIPARSYGLLIFFALSNGANLGIFYVVSIYLNTPLACTGYMRRICD
ncbi:MAG: hypothetical protein M1812_007517 [Candelaria pacifica]|nr:MAG: hypothetical protein M1812_007517 [Candelaria pacifica]